MKLYKYRPLNEFLYKELFYQELYFASYQELNDPLDLSARIDFSVEDEQQIEYLIWVIFKTTLAVSTDELTSRQKINNKNIIDFNQNEESRNGFKKNIFEKIGKLKELQENIWISDLEDLLIKVCQETKIGFEINYFNFKEEIIRLSRKFLENSHACCFSESNNDFLMWSHYASKHSGICLEFSIDSSSEFPYLMKGARKFDPENYSKGVSHWNIEEIIFKDAIKQVIYQERQPFINFFDFSPVFNNEGDCDLIGLSKSWTHKFARELKWVFSTKTSQWSYEKEWRLIEINFGNEKEPEERIMYYPLEAISSIYFGIRTPEKVKKRIAKIYNRLDKKIEFFDCVLTDGRYLDFETWENHDE
jgi:hypothetical protein